MKEKDKETEKIMSEGAQLKGQLKAQEASLLGLGMEELKLSGRLQESHGEVEFAAEEGDGLRRLHVLQSGSNQLQEGTSGITANVGVSFPPSPCVCVCSFLMFSKQIFL